MKLQGLVKVCAAMLFCLSNQQLLAQQLKLGTNPTLLDKNALLELKSDKQGFLLPRIIKAQILTGGALYNAAEGMLVYITDDKALYLKKTTGWEKIDFSILTAGTGIDITGNSIKNIGVTKFNTRTGDVLPATGDYALTQLSDVNITSPANNQLLQYQSGKWINSTLSYVPSARQITFSGGTGIATVTAAPAGTDLSADRIWTITADNSNPIWNANKLQSKSIVAPAPNEGDLLTFTGGNWISKAPTSGGATLPSGSVWEINQGGTGISWIGAVGTVLTVGADGKLTYSNQFLGKNDNITLNGDVTGTGNSYGLSTTLSNTGITAGAYTKITVDAKGRATYGTTLGTADLPNNIPLSKLDGSAATNGQVLKYNGTAWVPATVATGGVTSVGLALPSIFNVTVSPITTSGTLTATLNTQNPNLIFAGPATGAAAAPTFRSLVAADIPTLTNYIQNTTATQATSNFNISGNGVIGGTLTLGLTQGSIPFMGSGGLVSQKNSDLFWDGTNSFLGIGVNTALANKVTISGPPSTTVAPFTVNTSGLRLLNLAGKAGDAPNATVLSVNSAGDVILTKNPASNNWLVTGNTGVASGSFLGTNDDVAMVIKSNAQSYLEFGRRDLLGLTDTYPDYTDNNQKVTYVRSALQFEAPGAEFYKPMFFVNSDGNFRMKGSAAGTDLFEFGATGTGNNGGFDFIVGDDGDEPIIFKYYTFNATPTTKEIMRLQSGKVGIGVTDIPNATLQVNGSVSMSSIRTVTTTAVTVLDSDFTVICTNTGTITVTVPNAVAANKGRIYVIKKSNNGINRINITSTVSDIDIGNGGNSRTYYSTASAVAIQIQSDGAKWWVIN